LLGELMELRTPAKPATAALNTFWRASPACRHPERAGFAGGVAGG
jgi:hypothetical protein